MFDMTAEQRREFLLGRPRTAKLAVVRRDGRPHVTPVWIDLDGDDVMFTTHCTNPKGHAIRRDGRVCLCVDDETPPFAFVVIDGTTSVSQNRDDLRHWATRIGGRYMGAARAEEYGARNAAEGELLVRVRPTKIVARGGIAD